MTRPIVWACGILGMAVVSGGGFASRIPSMGASPTAEATVAVGDTVTLQQDLRGHYTVHPAIDGRTVRMMVDTGASLCAFSEEDARLAGIKVSPADFTKPMGTANGTVRAAPVRIGEIRIGTISVRNVEAVVIPRGQLGTSLLGMSFLRRLRGFDVASGRLTLKG